MSKKLRLQDVKNSYVAESNPAPASSVDELHHEILVCYPNYVTKELKFPWWSSKNILINICIKYKLRYEKRKSY